MSDTRRVLGLFFNPKSVAIIGASETPGKIGRVILENFAKKYKGAIYPVNPKYDEILGFKAYKSVREIPEKVDLAVIIVRAQLVPGIMDDLGAKGIRAAIIVSGGFSEIGEEGAILESQVREKALKYGIRVIGPNGLGIYNAETGVDTFFLPEERMKRPPPGRIALISQSGALAAAVLDWAAFKGIGISKVVSYGNKIDIDDVDLLEYFEHDDDIDIILFYVEGFKPSRGRKFIEITRRVVAKKSIIMVKGGKTPAGAMAATSHTAALAGTYEVLRAALRKAGVVEVESIDELFDASKCLLSYRELKGDRVAVITNAGGMGVLATDALYKKGFKIPRLSNELQSKLREKLPFHCVTVNPIDLTGDTDDERYRIVFEDILASAEIDAVVVIALFQIPTLTLRLADYIIEAKQKFGKPIIAVSFGGVFTAEFAKRLEKAGIPVYESPEKAARALRVLREYAFLKKRIH